MNAGLRCSNSVYEHYAEERKKELMAQNKMQGKGV